MKLAKALALVLFGVILLANVAEAQQGPNAPFVNVMPTRLADGPAEYWRGYPANVNLANSRLVEPPVEIEQPAEDAEEGCPLCDEKAIDEYTDKFLDRFIARLADTLAEKLTTRFLEKYTRSQRNRRCSRFVEDRDKSERGIKKWKSEGCKECEGCQECEECTTDECRSRCCRADRCCGGRGCVERSERAPLAHRCRHECCRHHRHRHHDDCCRLHRHGRRHHHHRRHHRHHRRHHRHHKRHHHHRRDSRWMQKKLWMRRNRDN